ncbi:VirB4 family type IV secretion/conjugal transfer ATPase [Luteibacter aegosomatis]|uniref:VirB4 family type IV secretion/conjugal transfer ATPase n=1 Tax=Luteibacter aegosomatis TaxID=2911537 RepID=UPI001FF76566|nr:VirB4 family type IV secretion/conjugal transfer ATPase [Luteibacter aegosomatis]UPG85912.1 VirB4 family type IV secretion/conjugal transfer ATPase [Luteibacter aegosomatis]
MTLVWFICGMAAIVAVLVIILFITIRKLDNEPRLDFRRPHGQAAADLLNYAAVVADGVIVCKNGAFMAAWMYEGDDAASSTDEQRETTSMRINQALARLGNGWMLHVDAVRRPASEYPDAASSHFPDRVSAAMDEERRRLFQMLGTTYEGYMVMTLTWYPPQIAQRRFVEMMFDDEAEVAGKTEQTTNLIAEFQRECTSFENGLSGVLKMTRLCAHSKLTEYGRRLVYDDFLRWLQYCVTGVDHPVVLPENPVYLDALIGGQDIWTGVAPRIGRRFIQVVAVEGFPLESYPGILASLADLPSQYRWSNRFIFMDPHEALRQMEKFRKKWRQKVRGFFDQIFQTSSGSVNYDALSMMKDAEAAIAEINSGLVAQGFYTSVVIVSDDDRVRLDRSVRQIEKAINARGFAARIESVNTMDALLGSFPGHGVENVRRPQLNTLNLADLLPTATIWTGEPDAPCPMYPPRSPPLMHCVTQGATPFRLNLHVNDLGHTFIFGPTGAGKSTHLGILAAQFRRYPGMSLYCFDKGRSLYPLVKACGGLHFDVGGDDDELAFCPLQFLETKSDRAWAMEWIDSMLALNGVQTTPAQRNEIGNAIVSMHQSGATTLSEFVLMIQEESIREALKVYTADGAMGHLLDASVDGLRLSDFAVFEIEDLMTMGDRFVLPVLLYLFRRIETSLKGQPAAIILDEAWLMLGHPVFRAKIREWLKVLRKANCLVVMATQGLSDAANSGILDVIVESTATKIFLPNPFARDEDAAALYRRMGLNARQIEILATAVQKRHYYYVSDKGRRLYDLALGPLALAFIGNADKESIAAIRALEARHGEGWVDEWLAGKGLRLADYGA